MNVSSLAHSYPLSPSPAAARHQLRRTLESADWAGDVDGVVLAVHEALMNSYRHAGGVTYAGYALHGRVLVVEVRDCGPGFDVDPYVERHPDAMAERGRGLWLISQIATGWDVHHRDGETSFVLRFQP